MHLVALLVLVFVPCCISRAVNDERRLEDEGKSMVNGQNFKQGQKYHDPPVNGLGDEGSTNENMQMNKAQARDSIIKDEDERRLEDEGKSMVNGQNFNPGQKYHDPPVNGLGDEGSTNVNMQMNKAQARDSIIKDEGNSMNDFPPDEPVYSKYSNSTSWCTRSGRSVISYYEALSPEECHAQCDNITGCIAVEYWEEYNDACFQCTDTSLITEYTNTYDLAFPVYVWIREWVKFFPRPSWCTASGRTLIAAEIPNPFECQKHCQAISGCNAVEYWETGSRRCYQCNDTSLVKPFTNQHASGYPVYVWAPEKS